MKAILVIEIDDDHMGKDINELHDRLNGYKCALRKLPQKKDIDDVEWGDDVGLGEMIGWNNCIDEIWGDGI